MLDRSIADEVEAAIHAGSAEKHLDTFRRVTDLFLASAEGFNEEQIELFGDVLVGNGPFGPPNVNVCGFRCHS